MPASNKRFGEIGGKVILRLRSVTIIRASVRLLTVSDNPNGVQSIPNFVKPPELSASVGQ